MTAIPFALRYAARSFARGGQQTALAVACVAFGVLSFTGTVLLTRAIEAALLIPAAESMGGDLDVRPADGRFTLAEADSVAWVVRAAGAEAATPLAPIPTRFLQVPGSGRLTLVSRVLGVDPGAYPAVGPFRLREGTLGEALAAPGGAVVTRDVAGSVGLDVGDRITLSAGIGEVPVHLEVRGIASLTPDRVGGTVFVSLETPAAHRGDVVSAVLVAAEDPDRVAQAARRAGWVASVPTTQDDGMARAFGVMLPAAGLLGLLLAGVGVATTMGVVLAQRREEVAALKAVGYGRTHLVLLFLVETALLGAVGGALGVVGGLAFGAGLFAAFGAALPILVEPVARPGVLAAGLGAGVATTVLFGMMAVARASAVRPVALLRGDPGPLPRTTRATLAGLGALLVVVYGALAGVLVGSVGLGLAVVALGVAGLVVVGGALVAVVAALIRVPLGGGTARLARRSLGRRPLRTAASLAALFAGVLAVALAAGVLGSARSQVDGQYVAFGEASVLVAGTESDRATVARAAPGVPARQVLSVGLTRATSGSDAVPVERVESRAVADGLGNAELSEGRLPAAPDEALAPEGGPLSVGDAVAVVSASGGTADLAVVGTYGPRAGGFLTRPSGLLVTERAARALGATAAAYLLRVPDGQVADTADRLGRALPHAAVLTGEDVNDYLTRIYEGLFVLVLAVAGLAFAAGAVLVANVVGLSLIERRHDLAVLKALGYRSWQVLGLIAAENALLGLVAGAAGSAVAVALTATIRSAVDVAVWVPPSVAVAAALGAAALAALTAVGAAWRTMRIRPAEALRAASA